MSMNSVNTIMIRCVGGHSEEWHSYLLRVSSRVQKDTKINILDKMEENANVHLSKTRFAGIDRDQQSQVQGLEEEFCEGSFQVSKSARYRASVLPGRTRDRFGTHEYRAVGLVVEDDGRLEGRLGGHQHPVGIRLEDVSAQTRVRVQVVSGQGRGEGRDQARDSQQAQQDAPACHSVGLP